VEKTACINRKKESTVYSTGEGRGGEGRRNESLKKEFYIK
jgi:hypothetical protein